MKLVSANDACYAAFFTASYPVFQMRMKNETVLTSIYMCYVGYDHVYPPSPPARPPCRLGT